MSRVVARPTALLDSTPEAAKITEPRSDAERRTANREVFEHIPSFLGYLSLLEQPEMPRAPGYVRFIRNATHNIAVVQGEDVTAGEEVPVYGFSLSPDGVREFVGIGRYTGEYGENQQMLAWADLKDLNNPVFRSADLMGVIEDPAQVSELTQLLAIGEDAAEWALD